MITQGKIGLIYGVFMVIFLSIIAIFLLCDYQVMEADTCQQISDTINKVTGFFRDL